MSKQTVDGILATVNMAGGFDADSFIPRGVKGLTRKQLNILRVRLLPEADNMTVLEKCALAKCSDRYWYDMADNETINAVIKDFMDKFLGRRLLPLWRVYIKLAMSGDRQALENLLSKKMVLTAADRGVGDRITNINVALVEQKREDNIKMGLSRFGVEVLNG